MHRFLYVFVAAGREGFWCFIVIFVIKNERKEKKNEMKDENERKKMKDENERKEEKKKFLNSS